MSGALPTGQITATVCPLYPEPEKGYTEKVIKEAPTEEPQKLTVVMQTSNNTRECGGCTACCEGWLTGEVNGHKFSPSIPCYYMVKGGCSIYEDRPEQPCKSFSCEWITNENYPAWMKPTESGVLAFIRTFTRKDGSVLPYRVVHETRPMSTEVLFFFILQHFRDQVPLRLQLKGTWHFLGPQDWVEAMTV